MKVLFEIPGLAHYLLPLALFESLLYSRDPIYRVYRVNHKFGKALILLIASQLMEVEKNCLAKMKGTYQSYKMTPTLSLYCENYWL